jgi:hypothetical protein
MVMVLYRVLDSLVELEEEKKEAEEDLKRYNAELKQLVAGGEKPKTEAQMKSYMKYALLTPSPSRLHRHAHRWHMMHVYI